MNAVWLLLPIVAPLVAAGLAWGSKALRSWLLVLAPLPALVVGLIGPEDGPVDLTWVLLELRLELGLVGRLLLVMSASVWAAAGASARHLVADQRTFPVLWLVTMAGNLGVLVAADVVSLYALFAVMTFAAYGLIVHARSPFVLRAGRVYIVMAVLGEVALLSGLAFGVAAAGATGYGEVTAAIVDAPQRDLLIGLLMVGFGVKAGVVPLHVWLPLAHPAAPVPASAVLSGAMIKAGLVGWLRVLPLGEIASPGWSGLMIGIGLMTAFGGVLLGLSQTDPKVVLAYSSVSQMGLMAVIVGVALGAPTTAPLAAVVAAMYAFHHGFAKASLFLAVGVYKNSGGVREHRLVVAGMTLAALALTGAPFTSGWIAKLATKQVLEELPSADAVTGSAKASGAEAVVTADLLTDLGAGRLTLLLSLAAVGTTLLMARLLWLVRKPDVDAATSSADRRSVGPWLALVAGVLVASWLLPWVVGSQLMPPAVTVADLWEGLWPVVLGVAVATVWSVLGRRRRLPAPSVPAGDVVVLFDAAASRLSRTATAALVPVRRAAHGLRTAQAAGHLVVLPGRGVDRLEEWLTRWRTAGGLFVLIAAVLLATLAVHGGWTGGSG